MNNKLKKLANQAGFGLRDGELYTAKLEHLPITQNMEKFAELIVKECIKVARDQHNPANLNYKPSDRFVEDLRQHFRVEE